MNLIEPAWLQSDAQSLATLLLSSHQRAFAMPLVVVPESSHPRLLAQELFAAGTVVLAHDGAPLDLGEGPRLTYANRAALQLWRLSWSSMVGMPSSRTAEPAQRASRQQALASAQQQQAISHYSGIRIDSQGRRFAIRGARIWSLLNERNQPCGQAAAFGDWHWL